MKSLMNWLASVFTWWNSATIGTLIFTANKGKQVGEDEQGNKYYEERKTPKGRAKRRWVIYNGTVEASRISSEWHGWLHHTFAEPPTEKPFVKKTWELPHSPNMTGTSRAYHPDGSLATPASRPHATGDYEAWSPE